MKTALNINELSFSFGEKAIFDSLDLTIKKGGEVVCILGPSGSGKTTLLKLINDRNVTYEILGKVECVEDSLPVFQNYNDTLLPWLTVKDNIVFGAKDKDISTVTKLLEISDLDNSYPEKLSGGQKQRVTLARALLRKVELLLLDEPLSSVDVGTRKRVLEKVKEFNKKSGTSALWITHDIEEAVIIADRILVITKEKKLKDISNSNSDSVASAALSELMRA